MRRMTTAAAQGARIPLLEAAVDSQAACARPDAPDLEVWFRLDGESLPYWRPRRDWLMAYCRTTCPVMEACREVALRLGDGHRADEMVRGGMSGPQLKQARLTGADRLAEARNADLADGREWERLTTLTKSLLVEALVNPEGRGTAEELAAQNERVSELAAETEQIRTARRARHGWNNAA